MLLSRSAACFTSDPCDAPASFLSNVFDAILRISREEGFARLYAGLGPNVQRAMLMTAGQIASYDSIKVVSGLTMSRNQGSLSPPHT